MNVLGHHLLCGSHISKRENFGCRQIARNSLSPSQEHNHREFLGISEGSEVSGKWARAKNPETYN